MLNAAIKVATRAPDARAALAQADSMLVNSTMPMELTPGPGALFSLASTRAHLALGDYAGAYAAAKRGANISLGVMFRPPLLLEYARGAARLNKPGEAIAAYQRYLTLRPHPEPGPASKLVEQARHELAMLTAEPQK